MSKKASRSHKKTSQSRKPTPSSPFRSWGRWVHLEQLEDRLVPAPFIYPAVGTTPLTLRQSGADIQIVNTLTPSQVLASQALAAIDAGVRVEGNGHDVPLTIDPSMPQVPGGVLFVGGVGTNNTLLGPNADADWILNGAGAGLVTVSTGLTVHFNGVENLRGGSAVDTFKVDPGGSIAGTIDAGGGTKDALVGDNVANAWQIQGPNQGTLNSQVAFASVENLIGGTDDDTFTFDSGAAVAGVIEGGGEADDTGDGSVGPDELATDTIDYSAFATQVSVNLRAGTATATGGVSNIDSFVAGTSGTDLVLGPDGVSVVWTVSGDNEVSVGNVAFAGFESLFGADNNADVFVIEGAGKWSGTVHGGTGGTDGLVFIDPADESVSRAFNPAGADSAGTATEFSKPVNYTGLDRVRFFNNDDPFNPIVTGTFFNDQIHVYADPAVAGGLKIDFSGTSITLTPLQVTLLQSLRIDAIEGTDVIVVASLPETFTGSLYLYGNRLQRNDLIYPNMPEDDPYSDTVLITGDITLDYLEVFADHIAVRDEVHIVTGDSGIFFRSRLIGVSTFENLLPGFGTNRSVSVDIGQNAVLEGGSIYFVVQAEDRSFAEVIGAGKEVANFVLDPLTNFLGSAVALPVKVLVKQSTATITLRSGSQFLSGGTVGMYATATADASGVASSSLVSVGYVQANATATVDIQTGVVIEAGAAAVVTATGTATANISASTSRSLDPIGALTPDGTSTQVALAVGVSNANVTSTITVAQGASITGGKTANVTAQGSVTSAATGEAGLDSDGAAGLGFGIELSNATIHTTVNGSVTALAQPGYTVKNEIDPLLAKSDYTTDQSAFGLMEGKTVELLSDVSDDLPAGTVMKYVGDPVSDTVNLAITAQDYTDESLWEITTPPVGYIDYATDRIFLGDTALVTEDVITYTNRRGVSIGGLSDGRTYVLVADGDDPGYYWLADNETQAIRASLGYVANNVIPLNPLGGALATDTNKRTFDASHVDATANTISLPRIATVNNTFELGQAVVYHATSVTFTSGDVLSNAIRIPGHGFTNGDPLRYVGVGIPANTPAGTLEIDTTYFVIRLDNDYFMLSATPGGAAIVLTPDASTPGRAAVSHKLTRYVEGLVDGATYYVAASTSQTNLQGNSRLTETQVIGLSELENEARGGVLIDFGPMRGTGYMLAAKHVLDSGFATGLGVVSQLNAASM